MALLKFILTLIVAAVLFGGSTEGRKAALRTYNLDPTFSRWPTKSQILYNLDANYTTAELGYIRAGVAQLMANLNGCVTFVETVASDTRFKIHVTPFNAAGVYQTFCYSYQGVVNDAVNQGLTEQLMIITRGPYGCLDGSLRSIMRYFAIVLGKRNEHQRGDRETYITVNTTNIAIPNAYRLYNTSEANWGLFAYDYCSITHNQVTDYATAGTNAFTVIAYPQAIPKLNNISNTDCQLISMMYNCPVSGCAAMDCTAARSAALNSSCPTNTMCTMAPDESSYLLGPYQLYQTLLLYKDSCIMEYKFNWTTGKLDPTRPPQPIVSYFPGPGGPTAPFPLSLNYMLPDPTTGGASLALTMCALNSASCLTCSTNPAVPTNAATCPNPATATGIINPSANVTSVTTQINLALGQIYQYVVLKSSARKEIGLMDSTFSTLYQSTTGFLSGQSTIVTITAIQILQDEQAVNPDMLAVFGVGADGLGYVGFVSMLLTADPSLPIAPYTWTAQPVPIGSAISQYC